MHIGLNLLFLVPGDVGGSEPLLTNLLRAMLQAGERFTVYAVNGFSEAYPDIAARAHVVEVPWSHGAQGPRIAAENSWLLAHARRSGIEVLHHGGGTAPFFHPIPDVVTIHDIQYVHHPGNFSGLKRRWLATNVPRAAHRSRLVAVPSAWVKADLVRSLSVPEDKVVVVPFGAEGLFEDGGVTAEEARTAYRLDRPYFFFPSRTYVHKNHEHLLQAFAKADVDCDLVFTGAPWHRDAEIMELAAALGIERKVRHLGRVPRTHLRGIYEAALALAYPTRFEGFGAPVLEAMSVGTPVIASDSTAVPEVVGDAGWLLPPNGLDAWADALRRILTEPGTRQDLSAKGSARAASFTWERSSQLMIDCYRRAAR